MGRGGLTPADKVIVELQEWGKLEWMVSGAIGNSDTMTVGRCTIEPGQQNPPHHHPNCDEILHVVSGTIDHRLGDRQLPMSAGDTISIPVGTVHNARNVGSEPAVLLIAFSTAERKVVGE
ncbi:cupin domain-containing protein [Kribbella sp. C-35]|uniref:cupin domain-containing protein n=1 Tax=Kribbella sp. C-35 TaxID=2789276 RepID=UPI00397CCC2E